MRIAAGRAGSFDSEPGGPIGWRGMTAVAKNIEREIRELALSDLLALHQSLVVSIHDWQ